MAEPTAPPLERILSRSEQAPRSIVDLALGRDPHRPPAADVVRPPTVKARLTAKVTSLPIPAPRGDWPLILCGSKRMYRTYSAEPHRHAPLVAPGEEVPRPIVVYSSIAPRRYDAAVAVLTGYRMEPLGAISGPDLALEGFQSIERFIRYWKGRYDKLGWRPNDMISVVELRPWTEPDDEEQGAWLLRRLYGEWL